MLFGFGFVVGALVVGVAWWVNRRSLNGIISDLKDAKSSAQTTVDEVKAKLP